MKNFLIITALSLTSFSLIGQNCPQNENITRFMARGKAALRTAEKPEDYKLAAAEFKKALEYDDDAKCPDIQYNLALCYEPMGKLDPGYYRQAISSLRTYLSLKPNAENKSEIQEKIYEIEFFLEKAGGVSLNDLIGTWKFYWGRGEEGEIFDIEIYKNKGDLYAKYCGTKITHIGIYKKKRVFTRGGEQIIENKYESSVIKYKDGTISFEAKPHIQHSTMYDDDRFNKNDEGTFKYWEIEYRLQVVNGMLKGERIHKKYKKGSAHGKDFDWQIDYECNDCDTYPVYFVKQR
jgi:tetratricopeptide (TPR) repeat protein